MRSNDDIVLAARILGTASLLPGRPRTTAEIVAALPREGDPAKWAQNWEQKTGIKTRHWAEPGTRVAPLAAQVLRGALEAAGLPATALRRIIFVTSASPDM